MEANPSQNSKNAELLPPAANPASFPWHHRGSCAPWHPVPAQGEAPWFLASSGQDSQHHHSTGTSMELAVCAPLERCSQSVCASQTPEICCIWLLRPSRSLPGERQPQGHFSMDGGPGECKILQEENLLKALNSAFSPSSPTEVTSNYQRL